MQIAWQSNPTRAERLRVTRTRVVAVGRSSWWDEAMVGGAFCGAPHFGDARLRAPVQPPRVSSVLAAGILIVSMRASSCGAFAAAARVVPVASRRSSPVALSSCGEAPAAARRAALARASARVPRGRVAASTRATAEDDASAATAMDSEPLLLRHAGLEGDALVASVDATKATEIRAELKVFGVNTAGLKAQIAERLVECYRITVRPPTERSPSRRSEREHRPDPRRPPPRHRTRCPNPARRGG